MRDSAPSPIATSPRPGCSGTRRLLGCWRSTAPARVTTPGGCGPFSWRSCGRSGGRWTLGNPGLAPGVSETRSVIANPGPSPGTWGDMTREEALALMEEHTQSPSLRQHMLAVEAAMRAYAEKHGEDPETWGMVGLLHDFDYQKFPHHEHAPGDGLPSGGVGLPRQKGLPEPWCGAILGHGTYTGVPRDTLMARTLFAV